MQVDLSVVDQLKSLKQVIQALRRRLTFDENVQCQIITIADTGPALTPLTVTHKLGKVPLGYIVNLDKHGSTRDVNRVAWTTTQMQLEFSVANAKAYLIVF